MIMWISVFLDSEDGIEKEENFDYVLAATGRCPNVKDLDLQNTVSFSFNTK